MRILYLSAALLTAFAFTAFAGGEQEHGDASHDHGEATGGNDHHAGEASNDDRGNLDEPPTVAVTHWTDQMELFMEYPVLVANEPGRFIIHLTILEGFQPVREGSIGLHFKGSDGMKHEIVANELLREGIFAPTVRLPQPGAYEFVLSYHGGGAQSTFTISDFTVFPNLDAIPIAIDEASSDEIGFLKEQQWKIPFETMQTETRLVKRGVWAIGEVLPSPSAYAAIVAPVDGFVQIATNGSLALPGSMVRRGDVLATIAPPVQGESWANSRLAFEQAERDYERARRLREKEAISQRELEQSRNKYLAMKGGIESLAGGGDVNALALEAPIDGIIIEWQVRPGQRVNAGDKLMAVVDPSVVWLKVNVYESDFRSLGQPVGAYVNADGASGGWEIPESDMRVLTTGGALDPVTRTVPVLLEVANGDGRLTINESTPVELYASDGEWATAVPKAAVYEDDGLNVVFVQTGGESFVKRPVLRGPHHAGWEAILEGLHPGERVVTRGGYHVKLASTSAEIGHGHAH